MAGNTGDDDLEEFLAKVDKLQSIVTGMSSDDKEVQEEFIQKADEELTKEHVSKTVNRTVINKDAYKYDTPEPAPSEPDGQVDQDAFLKNLEADAQARYERKQASRKRATVIKDKGNLAFKNGDFKRAIELYSDAMDIIKDYSDLFTNRAQAYIKISEYDKAIEDCDFAMRIDEKCVKAYITKGRAYLAKKKYTKAISTYEEVLEFDPKQEKIVKEYIAAAKLAKAAAKAEKKVELLYEKGNEEIQTIAELLKKIKKEDQPALYYTGGCQLLVPMLKDKMSCTLFRTHGGFSIISSNEVIIRCMTMSDNLSSEQVDLCSTVLDLYTASCKNIEENQKVLSEMPELLDKCMDMLETSQYPQITEACVVFMYTMSQNDVGKKAIVNKLDIVRLIQSLFELIMASSKVSKEAVDTLTNLATEKRFLHKVYARIKDPVLPLIEKLLKKHEEIEKRLLLSCLLFIGTFAAESSLIDQMTTHKGFWEGCVKILNLESDDRIIVVMLGMMMNVSLKTSDALKSMAQEIIKASVEYVTNYDDNIKQRSYGLISRLISYSEECINIACQHFLPMHIMHLLPDGEETTLIHAVKILAVVTRYNEGARKTVVECDPELKVLRASLGECEDIVVADSALCIANMCQDREICVSLVDTNIIQELLARTDSLNSAIKQNCAIAVAKLVSNDVRHMKKLKEHNGFDILHSCVKHLKS